MTTRSTRWIQANLTCYDDEEYATRELPRRGRAQLQGLTEEQEVEQEVEQDEPCPWLSAARPGTPRQENETLLVLLLGKH